MVSPFLEPLRKSKVKRSYKMIKCLRNLLTQNVETLESDHTLKKMKQFQFEDKEA